VVTVRNEESNLLNLLDSIKTQDYNAYEVFIVHSGMDKTDELLVAEFCDKDQRFQLVRASADDFSWLEERAAGRYLLLLDSNTQIHKGLINALIYRTRVFKLGIISVVPSQIIRKFKQWLLLPLSDFVLLNMMPLRLIRLIKSPVLANANSDCLFLDAEICFEKQWLSRLDPVKGATELLKIVKQDRVKAETLLGNHLIDRHSFLAENGELDRAADNLRFYFNNNVFAALIYVFLVVLGPIIILFGFDLNVLILPFGLIFLSRVMISFLTAQNPIYNLLLHPLQMLMLVVVYIRAITRQLLTHSKHKTA